MLGLWSIKNKSFTKSKKNLSEKSKAIKVKVASTKNMNQNKKSQKPKSKTKLLSRNHSTGGKSKSGGTVGKAKKVKA